MARRLWIAGLCLATTAGALTAQEGPSHEQDVARLLTLMDVEPTLASLGQGFLAHFLMLAFELPAEDRAILEDAVTQAFSSEAVRGSLVSALADAAPTNETRIVLDAYQTGPLAELRTLGQEYQPDRSLAEFSQDLSALDPERLQLMVALVQAAGAGDLALVVDDRLQALARQFYRELGGDLEPLPALTDDQEQARYRNRIVGLGVESMYRFEPASSELVQSAAAAHANPPSRDFFAHYAEALLTAIDDAGQRLGALVASGAPTADPQSGFADEDPTESTPCLVLTCGFVVDWATREPVGGTLLYRSPGDFQDHTLETLAAAGYRLIRGGVPEGLTIRIRPGTQRARCEVVSGTDPVVCQAVGDVRVEFVGSYPGFDGRPSFVVRNRCGANRVMAADGIASLVAAMIHYELTTFEGDERRRPRC